MKEKSFYPIPARLRRMIKQLILVLGCLISVSSYQITQVTAVVVRNTSVVCPVTQDCLHAYSFDVIAGDVGLDYALSAIASQQDGAATKAARAALYTIQKNYR